MSSKRYSEEQIIGVLKEIDNGASMAGVARSHGIGIQTIYAWKKRFAGMSQSELAELKALQSENARLKRIVASQALDIDALKELQKGKCLQSRYVGGEPFFKA
jgi:putative transposase